MPSAQSFVVRDSPGGAAASAPGGAALKSIASGITIAPDSICANYSRPGVEIVCRSARERCGTSDPACAEIDAFESTTGYAIDTGEP